MLGSVLFVDDDPLDLELMRYAYDQSGGRGELRTERDPERAFRELSQMHRERRAPDVVLIDLRMPRMDGFQFAGRVRRELPGLTSRLLFFSTSRHPEDRERARAMGLSLETKPDELAGYVALLERLGEEADG